MTDREQEAEIARLKAQVRSLLEPNGSPGRYAKREEQPDDSEINDAIANADDWFDALWEIATKYDVPVTNNNPRWQEGRFLRPIAEFIGDIDDAAKKWIAAHRPTEPDEDNWEYGRTVGDRTEVWHNAEDAEEWANRLGGDVKRRRRATPAGPWEPVTPREEQP